jgi:hypothetical protein
MKSLTIAIPTLMQIGVVAALCVAATSATTPPPSTSEPATELHQLRLQREQIEARLEFIQSKTRVFLPRGMGRMANTPAPGASSPASAQELAPQPEIR